MPFVLFRLLWRSIKQPAYRLRWSERFGLFDPPQKGGGLWVHAVSVGEVQAIAPLVRQLMDSHPEMPLCITTTTPTGSDQVRRLFGDQVFHVYLPYDLPFAVRRFLQRVQPQYLLMVETEIWPNLLKICSERGVRTLLANARLSTRSLHRYQRVEFFAREIFGLIDCVAAQSDDDASHFAALGVDAQAISVTGSIKFDVEIPASVEEQAEVMRRNWPGRPVWVAGSTHEGEEDIVLEAQQLILQQVPDTLLVLVPRHPDRFDRVANMIKRRGLKFRRRSKGKIPEAATQVYLGDSMGELTVMLGAADAALIGGSLVNVGGHNMLEAAAQGVPSCFGPYTFNFPLISNMLLECHASQRVIDATSLANLMITWLSDAAVRSTAGEAGRQMIDRNRGALQRLEVITEKLIA